MIFSGLMIPFLGTTLGAGIVFFMKGSMNQKLEKMLLRWPLELRFRIFQKGRLSQCLFADCSCSLAASAVVRDFSVVNVS